MRPPVAPYLTVSPAMAAVAFYTAVFGARQKAIMPALDGLRIMHCELEINGGSACSPTPFPPLPARGKTRGAEPHDARAHPENAPAAQRGLPGKQAAHDRHGRAAQQQPRGARLPRTARAELPLDDRGQGRTRLNQERELVDDHCLRLIPQRAEQQCDRVTPVLERSGDRHPLADPGWGEPGKRMTPNFTTRWTPSRRRWPRPPHRAGC